MPRTAHNINGRTLVALGTALNAWFTANPAVFIRYFDFIGADMESLNGYELSVQILADTDGQPAAVNPPYSCTLWQAQSPTALQVLIDAQIALAPTIWYQGPFFVNLSKRRRTADYIGMLLQTTDTTNGPANWTPT